MEIIIYIGTVIFSFIIEAINGIKTLDGLAKRGYKFDNLKLLSFDRILYLLFVFVPFINLIVTIKNISDTNQLKKLSPKQLFYKKNIIPFTKGEMDLYKNNSSILNIINLNINNHAKPNMVLSYMKDGLENMIYFTNENDINIIISTSGPISNLSRYEQYDQLQNQLKKLNFTKMKDVEINAKKDNKKEFISQKVNEYEKLQLLKQSLLNEEKMHIEKQKVYTKNYL